MDERILRELGKLIEIKKAIRPEIFFKLTNYIEKTFFGEEGKVIGLQWEGNSRTQSSLDTIRIICTVIINKDAKLKCYKDRPELNIKTIIAEVFSIIEGDNPEEGKKTT